MISLHETDLLAWTQEQAELLRTGQLGLIDVSHIAEAIERVCQVEQRTLGTRLSQLLALLLRWRYGAVRTPEARSRILALRQAIGAQLARVPGLHRLLDELGWTDLVWADALAEAGGDADLDALPRGCPWQWEQVLAAQYYPE